MARLLGSWGTQQPPSYSATQLPSYPATGFAAEVDLPGGADGDHAHRRQPAAFDQALTQVFNTLIGLPATGGQPVAVTHTDTNSGDTSHLFPVFLPDGRRFLFYSVPSNTVWIGSLDSSQVVRLLSADSAAWCASGYLLFTRQDVLFAQPFDAGAGTLGGTATTVARQIFRDANGYPAVSASATGALAYRTGIAATQTQLNWIDRSGRVLSGVGEPGYYRNPVLSPDGGAVAVEAVDPQGRNQDIWTADVTRGGLSRFTFDPHNDVYPVWSADGQRIMFGSDRERGIFKLYDKASNGAGAERLLAKSSDDMAPYSRSADGRFLLFRLNVTNTGILPLVGESKPRPLLQAAFSQNQAQPSPDGRWLAYTSNESGQYEVYIKNFPEATGKWQVSQGGGTYPRWRADGKELYYYAAGERMTAVSIAGDAAVSIGSPIVLFGKHFVNGVNAAVGFRAQYDTQDGMRFLANIPVDEEPSSPITVVLNWDRSLTR